MEPRFELVSSRRNGRIGYRYRVLVGSFGRVAFVTESWGESESALIEASQSWRWRRRERAKRAATVRRLRDIRRELAEGGAL